MKFRFLHFISAILIVFSTSAIFCQSVSLSGVKSSSGGVNGWSFVATENIPSGTRIFFTDEDWIAASAQFDCHPCVSGIESLFQWEASGTFDKGCVGVVVEGGTSNTAVLSCSAGCNCGTITVLDPAFSISTSDPWYAFSSSTPSGSPSDIMANVATIHSAWSFTQPMDGAKNPIGTFPTALIIDINNSSGAQFKVSLRGAPVNKTDLLDDNNYETWNASSVIFQAISLPVELVSFKGTSTKDGIELFWKTARENNNKGFEIERSANGKNWDEIEFIQGYGTTEEIQNYTYMDENPLDGVSYYRLKQIDFDGQFEYSNIVRFSNKNESTTIDIWPNPVVNTLSLQLKEVPNEDVTLTILDLNGRKMFNQRVDRKTSQLDLDISQLEKGMYLVQIQIGQQIESHRFVKN